MRYGLKGARWAPIILDNDENAMPIYGTPRDIGGINEINEALNFAEAKAFANNKQEIVIRDFTDGTLETKVLYQTVEVSAELLGCKNDGDGGLIYGSEDVQPFGCFGAYHNIMDSHKKKYYEVMFYSKVQAYVESKTHKTKEDSVGLEYQPVSFYVFKPKCGLHKIERRFKTENEAIEYLDKLFAGTAVIPGIESNPEPDPDCKHEWAVTFTWASDYSTCTARAVCSKCGGVEILECNVSYVTENPDCETAGKTTYMATIEIDGQTFSDTKIKTIAATGHTYGDPEFTWVQTTADTAEPTCTATFTCETCGATETVGCDVNSSRDGDYVTYTATCKMNGKTYTDALDPVYDPEPDVDKTELKEAIDEAAQLNEEDYSADSWAVFHTAYLAAVSVYEDENASEADVTNALADLNDAMSKLQPAECEHEWTVEFVWADDYTTCNATFTCTKCDDTQTAVCNIDTETVEPTDTETGKTTYTATVEFESETYTDVKEDILPAKGHEYGDPVFNWANDYTGCEAVFKCINEDDTQTIICDIDTKTDAATCTDDGLITYTATALFDNKEYTDTKTETIPATGHTYGEPEFVWADDFMSCQAVFTCEAGDDTQTVDCEITSERDEDDSDYIDFTATVEFNGNTYTDVKQVYVPEGNPDDDGHGEVVEEGALNDEETVTYKLYEDKTLIIEGEGSIKDYSSSSGSRSPFYGRTDVWALEFDEESNVNTIGAYLFYNCTGLLTIEIPDTVTSIGNYAFQNCTGLTSLTFPDGVSIGQYAFQSCTGLTSLTFPDGVSIGQYAFRGCTGLTSLTFPDDTSTIKLGDYAFQNCSGFKTTEGLPIVMFTSWGEFAGWTGLTDIVWPDGLTSIGNYAFQSCTGLTSLTFPDGVSISSYAFYNCTGLTSLTFPDGVSTSLQSFYNCTGLTSLTFGNNILIGASTFDRCGIANEDALIVIFTGSAPTSIDTSNSFNATIANVYYPEDKDGWDTFNFTATYGGTLTWIPYNSADGIPDLDADS